MLLRGNRLRDFPRILVKPPKPLHSRQTVHSQAEIKSVFLPVYHAELDIVDIEDKNQGKRSLRAALFVFLQP